MRVAKLAGRGRSSLDEFDSADALEMAVPEQFEVNDRSSAEWLVRTVVEIDAHMARVKVQAEKELNRTQRDRDFLLFRYGPQLERWTREQLRQTKGRRKSVLLLSGTVGFRATCQRLVVEDPSAALRWAKQFCRSAVVTIERLSKTQLKAHLTATGELPAGAYLQSPRQVFFVK
jgi:hypothetical protein